MLVVILNKYVKTEEFALNVFKVILLFKVKYLVIANMSEVVDPLWQSYVYMGRGGVFKYMLAPINYRIFT